MDEITQRRKRNLKRLIDSPRFNGEAIALAKAANLDKSRVSQMLHPEWAFGERAARKLCETLGLPTGYFEAEPDQKTIRDTVNLSSGITEIPLLDRRTAGMHKRYTLDGEEPPATHVHPGAGDNLFAYTVDDDMMEPLIPFNSRAIISTKLKPKHGSIVLVETDGISVLRKLVIDGQAQLLETAKYQTVKPLNGTILGVVHMLSFLFADLGEEE